MKKFRKRKGKANRIPFNILKPPKGHRRSRPHVSREVMQVHTAFRKYSEASSRHHNNLDNDFTDEAERVDDSIYQDNSSPAAIPSLYQSYTQRKTKAAEKWGEVRSGIEETLLQQHCLNENTLCFQCDSKASVRCQECGPYFYCVECTNKLHENRNFHHCPEIWKVRTRTLQKHYLLYTYKCRMIVSFQ